MQGMASGELKQIIFRIQCCLAIFFLLLLPICNSYVDLFFLKEYSIIFLVLCLPLPKQIFVTTPSSFQKCGSAYASECIVELV